MSSFFSGLKVLFYVICGIFGIGFIYVLYFIFANPYEVDNKSIERALYAKNFEKAEIQLEKMRRKAERSPLLYRKDNLEMYWDTYFSVINSEVNYLLDDEDDYEIIAKRLVSLLQGKRIGLTPPYVGTTNDKKVIQENEKYNEITSKLNSILDIIIQRAIARKDRNLATSIVNCYRPVLEKNYVSGGLLSKASFDFSYLYDAQNNANELVTNAIQEGRL